jgi:HD-like signal output (HDOD) protein
MLALRKLWTSLLRRFFGKPAVRVPRADPARHVTAPRSRVEHPSDDTAHAVPSSTPRAFHLDGPTPGVLSDWESGVLAEIGKRVQSGRLQVPQIPATSMAAMSLASDPGIEIRKLADLIHKDPVLSTDVLRTANSVSYASHTPAETINDAIMRMGLRGLRSILLSISVRSSILTGRGVDDFAEEVWRQANSMAGIARAVSSILGFDPERAYLIGLLQDLGKIPLLALLRETVPADRALNVSIVGLAFRDHHERAGVNMARAWKLSDEIASIAGGHHD